MVKITHNETEYTLVITRKSVRKAGKEIESLQSGGLDSLYGMFHLGFIANYPHMTAEETDDILEDFAENGTYNINKDIIEFLAKDFEAVFKSFEVENPKKRPILK